MHSDSNSRSELDEASEATQAPSEVAALYLARHELHSFGWSDRFFGEDNQVRARVAELEGTVGEEIAQQVKHLVSVEREIHDDPWSDGPGLRKAVPRADLLEVTPDTKWLEQGHCSETVAEVSLRWLILRIMPAQGCAHACGQRAECFGAWPFIAVVIPFCFVRTQEFGFNEMAGESAAAHRAGNAGMRPATHDS
jgi:hypothetical protein